MPLPRRCVALEQVVDSVQGGEGFDFSALARARRTRSRPPGTVATPSCKKIACTAFDNFHRLLIISISGVSFDLQGRDQGAPSVAF
jgi:hypothetical protein